MATITLEEFHNFSIAAVALSSLCALLGVYVLMFAVAFWRNCERVRRTSSAPWRYLRIVTVVIFVNLVLHIASQATLFARARIIPVPEDEMLRWTIPTGMVQGLTTTIVGFLSDGLLAWRFFNLFSRRQWALWAPAATIAINAILGLSANFMSLAIYHSPELYHAKYHQLSLQLGVAWGWVMFVIHTIMTFAILVRLCQVAHLQNIQARSNTRPMTRCHGRIAEGMYHLRKASRYSRVLRAIGESYSVTWLGLLMYEIASVAPKGRVTTDLDVGRVMGTILPTFFGISQCLVIIAVANNEESLTLESPPPSPRVALGPNGQRCKQNDTMPTSAKTERKLTWEARVLVEKIPGQLETQQQTTLWADSNAPDEVYTQ